MRDKRPHLSVVLPTYNRGEILADTVSALLSQSYTDYELIVIDQTDCDEYQLDSVVKKQLLKNRHVRWYEAHPNSLTAARNAGIRLAKGKIILFLDDDIKVEENLFARHVAAHRENNVVAVAGSVTQKGHQQYQEPVYFDKYGFQHGLFNSPDPADATTFPGGNASFSRTAALKAGLFDESFTGSAVREESEFASRIIKFGRIVYRPSANILHLAVPFGGCRIYSHQYDNLEYYFNEFRFVFKTVRWWRLPAALVLRYARFTLQGHPLRNFVRRSVLYAVGLAISIKRLVLPVSIDMETRRQK